MSEAMKQVVIRTGSIVLAFFIIVVIVAAWGMYKKPCGCNGGTGGTPALKPNDGTVINPQPAPVAGTAQSVFSGDGFEYV